MIREYLQSWFNRSREYPLPVYWVLFIGLWILAVATAVVVFVNREHLDLRKIALYATLLGAYPVTERIAYRIPQQVGQRVHEPLRYLLALAWWIMIFGAASEYALRPISQWIVTAIGSFLMIMGTGLRVWRVYTLGRYYSGHIETWTGQTVIQTGPYRVLRHPGYAGNLLQAIGLPLVVNAYGILIWSAIVAGLFIYRLAVCRRNRYFTDENGRPNKDQPVIRVRKA
jgi:isoprenylcysteine carboxyl methyltransferase (ICMT) family protein YpbQ